MKIVLLSGYSQSGKSTVAQLLTERYGAIQFAFADELKVIVAKEYKFPFEWTQTQEGKQQELPCGMRVRDVLIKRGQEIRAEQNDPGYFARLVAQRIKTLSEDALIVISDWRLPIELETLKEELPLPFGEIYTVRIQRDGQSESPVKDSLTEHSLDEFPFGYRVSNSGTNLHQLKLAVTTLMFSVESFSPK